MNDKPGIKAAIDIVNQYHELKLKELYDEVGLYSLEKIKTTDKLISSIVKDIVFLLELRLKQ